MTTNPDRPAALAPPIAFGDALTPIKLYNGLMTITQNGTMFQADGKIWFEWLPSPTVRFEIPDYPQRLDLNPAGVTLTLEMTEGTKITHAHVAGKSNPMKFPGHKNSVAGVVGERIVHGKEALANYALFLLPNLESVRASVVIDYPNGVISASRNVLRGGGWVTPGCRSDWIIASVLVRPLALPRLLAMSATSSALGIQASFLSSSSKRWNFQG